MAINAEKLLFVDDEPSLLAGIRRQFRNKYNVSTAEGGPEGLQLMQTDGPFAVVISDMRMPEMNGIQFLTEAAKLNKDTVRMMLTGNADLTTAMHAVNEGNIFRFLVKPCHRDTMEWAINAAVEQYRLVTAERELLEGTLKGSVQVLTDVLALVNPVAFSSSSRVRGYVKQVAQSLGLDQSWRYELAALLSQVGCVSVPPDTVEKYNAGAELSEDEIRMMADHPGIGENLLAKIPRLKEVAEIIGRQQSISKEYSPGGSLPKQPAMLGALILKAAIDFDRLLTQGRSQPQAIGILKKQPDDYPPVVLDALMHVDVVNAEVEMRVVKISNLNSSMTLAEDIRTSKNILVAARGQQVTFSMRKLLDNFSSRKEIKEEVCVYVPEGGAKETTTAPVTASTSRSPTNIDEPNPERVMY